MGSETLNPTGPETDGPQEITSNLRVLTNTFDKIRLLSLADADYQEERSRRSGAPFDRRERLLYATAILSDILLPKSGDIVRDLGEEADYWTGLIERAGPSDTKGGTQARRITPLDGNGRILDHIRDNLELVQTIQKITNKSKEEIEATLERLGYSNDAIRKILASIATTAIIGGLEAGTIATPLVATFIDPIVEGVNNPQIAAAIVPAAIALNMAGMAYNGRRIRKGLDNPNLGRSLNIVLTVMHFPFKNNKLHDWVILGLAYFPQMIQLTTGLIALQAGERGIAYAATVDLLNGANQFTQGVLTLALEKIADHRAQNLSTASDPVVSVHKFGNDLR